MLVACDGSTSVGTPSGWTVDLNVSEPDYSRFIWLHKASAGDTTATFTTSTSSLAIYFFEIEGTHALDQSATGGVANTEYIVLPSITPSAGALLFSVACTAISSVVWPVYSPSIGPWRQRINLAPNSSGGRALVGWIGSYAAAGGSVVLPPPMDIYWSQFASAGIAYATFSIL
jgi:hypothetical protein